MLSDYTVNVLSGQINFQLSKLNGNPVLLHHNVECSS